MEAVDLARLQFALTVGFHILWPTLTIGLAGFVVCLSALWWRTGDPAYRALLRFWTRLFALSFVMGVVTGLVLSYEIGANWAGYARATSNVLGPLFMYEALTAFFLEAGFIGILLFGEGRVSRGAHFFAGCMVLLGALLSSTWILAANSWMQTPAGAVVDAAGVFHVASWPAVILSPSFPYRLMHMVCASFLTTAFVVAGVSSFHLWRGSSVPASRVGLSMAMWAALVLAPLQIFLGDLHGRNTLAHQPTKLAAMEGLWDTGRGVPMTLFAWPDMAAEANRYAVEIPRLASLYLTHSWDGEVQGLKAVPAADRPNVPLVFFAFRVMVGIGVLMLAAAIAGAVLRWRGRLHVARWFHGVAMLMTPIGFVAVLAGWTVTETGRQPYVVYGLLRTADAVAPVAAGAVATTLALFLVLYNLLLLAFLWVALRLVLAGPEETAGVAPALRPAVPRLAPAVPVPGE